MEQKLIELKARTAGATNKDTFKPNRFYRKTASGAECADWDEQTRRLSEWTYHGPYVPESAERI